MLEDDWQLEPRRISLGQGLSKLRMLATRRLLVMLLQLLHLQHPRPTVMLIRRKRHDPLLSHLFLLSGGKASCQRHAMIF